MSYSVKLAPILSPTWFPLIAFRFYGSPRSTLVPETLISQTVGFNATAFFLFFVIITSICHATHHLVVSISEEIGSDHLQLLSLNSFIFLGGVWLSE